jgi:hypothetical protein
MVSVVPVDGNGDKRRAKVCRPQGIQRPSQWIDGILAELQTPLLERPLASGAASMFGGRQLVLLAVIKQEYSTGWATYQ